MSTVVNADCSEAKIPSIGTNKSDNKTNLSRLDGSRNWAILFVQSV